MGKMTGNLALLELLRQEGVRYIFGNPGTTELPLMDALAQSEDFTYILGLQEGVVMALAGGYAQASGRLGFVNVHVAPGLGNTLGLMYTAYMTRVPLLVTAGQQDRSLQLQEPLLWGNLVKMAEPYTKWAYEVQRVDDLPQAVRRAIKVAQTPPAGPVFLSLPMDVLYEATDLDLSAPPRPSLRTQGNAEDLQQAATLLAAAQSPVILVGDRVAYSEALAEVVELAELLGARVFAEPIANTTSFPTDHPLFAGFLPVFGHQIRQALDPADLILVIGMNLFKPFLPSSTPSLPPGVPLIQLDTDPWEIGKNHPVTVGILADPKAGVAALTSLLASRLSATARQKAQERRQQYGATRQAERESLEAHAAAEEDRVPMAPIVLMRELARHLPPDVVIMNESVTSGRTLREFLTCRDSKSYFGPKGGGLGWGLPATIGVKLALPERPVVGLLGEGSAMYAIQGLWTAAHYQVPVLFVICNNAQYRILKGGLLAFKSEAAKQGKFIGMDLTEPEIDFVSLAESMGVTAERVTHFQEVGPALQRALARPGPSLIDVPLDRSVKALF
ncbi:MAG: thiamine pyrophosphate-binding protein [Nitrospinota bacterium]|nr:MAG: thiamine pyrophosphate-binding protein [Nitrospinota bacterium]